MALINLNDPTARGDSTAPNDQQVSTGSQVYVPNATPLPTLPEHLSSGNQEIDSFSQHDFNLQQVSNNITNIADTESLQNVATHNIPTQTIEPLVSNQAQQGELNLKTYDLPDIIEEAILKGASDIHISTGHRVIVRVDGNLETLSSSLMTESIVERYAAEFLKNKQGVNLNDITEVDVGYTFGKRRLRVNIFRQMGVLSVAARIIPERIPSLDELDLPAILKEFINIKSGFVLVTGPTGSGKSTTLAATLNYINTNASKHIITLEDPVEFIFPKDQSLIDQRELGHDFESWESALKSMMRQDPDIVLVGEMRDHATIASAITLAETGHLVFATLAATLNYINTNTSKHIITLEDPIEFIFPKDQSLIDQRELGHDFESWESALKSMMRQDPDIVLVGEMRDHATIASAITLAETGHLVFATLHTNSASQTVDRIIDVFPENQQLQIRTQLANVLTTVISQRLLPVSGGGRKSAMEIMIATSAVKNAIREGKSHQIDNMIQTGQDVGMISMEQSLVNLVRKGVITQDTAMSYSIKPDQLTQLLQRS